MTSRVRIQPTARRELDGIIAYLAAFGPNTARSFLDDWTHMLETLRDGVVEYGLSRFDVLARLGYRAAPVGEYIALYFREDDDVVIAHLFHQSQDYARIVIGDK